MTEIPDPGFRVDSGPLKFGDDWPGIFMRGDHALPISRVLRHIAANQGLRETWANYLRGVADELATCFEGAQERKGCSEAP